MSTPLGQFYRPVALVLTIVLSGCGGGGSSSTNTAPTTTGIGTISYVSGLGSSQSVNPASGTSTTTSITSTNTGRTYAVSVYVPASASASQAPLPAIYSADGQYLFSDIVAALQAAGTSAYVVSVNYIDSEERSADYLLPGANAYFKFFANELIPSIEAQYRIDPTKRTLFGYSYSGVFVMAALFYDDPSNRLFSGIASIDGSFFTDPTDIDELEAQTFASSPELPVAVYMTCSPSQLSANPGNCESALPLFSLVANQGFKGVTAAQFFEYMDANHSTVVAPSVQAAVSGLFGSH